MNLTHNGTIFLHHAERVMVAINDAVRAPGNDARSSLEGELRLAMTYTVAGYFMPPIWSDSIRYRGAFDAKYSRTRKTSLRNPNPFAKAFMVGKRA